MIYLDTSALLKLYVMEDGSKEVQALLESQPAPLPISEILEMELCNALKLKVFWGDLTAEQSDEQIQYFRNRKKRGLYYYPEVNRSTLMAEFKVLSERTPHLGCRTMDILHVAYANIYGANQFITFDAKQRKLAEEAGLKAPTL